ncbi:family 16 glycosylhydrolase [Paenibacillus sp. SYP-B3998]|uniref:Family 16 glycosylhydrolase n=1 Tax=Paenibacillus sp. SYP-B3998 TaxID=2678564 RepID=A0A6G4A6C6_9BACL|nr:RICIN domain-containing protein [Paenibacillus sp. SYP-B3998]NEW09359.1 family 16 glycosylhydrolase [Paenibacillus sp. SYP-B3998]
MKMMFLYTVICLMLFCLFSAPLPSIKAATTWNLVWSDEFNGNSGTSPDAGKWKYDIGGNGWGNNELEYYTDSRNNSYLDGNGNLIIKAIKENVGGNPYTSARLLTKGLFTQAYGKFEARIKLPYWKGIWPAFWMLGDNLDSAGWPNCGEIDIMENLGQDSSRIYGTAHGPGYSGSGGIGKSYSLPNGQKFKDAFHVFSIEWEPTQIRWYVDGNIYHTFNKSQLGAGQTWVYDHPFFMIMNLAVGGNWPGNPDASTKFPQTMAIDYVRVYTAGSTPIQTGAVYKLINMNSGKALDIYAAGTADGTNVQIYTDNDKAAQKWQVFANADGSYKLINPNSGKSLDVDGAGITDGTNVQIWSDNGTAAQKWNIVDNGDGSFKLINIGSGKALDVSSGAIVNGANVQIWSDNGTGAQKWRMIKA